jgi:hypothetical protein
MSAPGPEPIESQGALNVTTLIPDLQFADQQGGPAEQPYHRPLGRYNSSVERQPKSAPAPPRFAIDLVVEACPCA